jgi:hypothetical protein
MANGHRHTTDGEILASILVGLNNSTDPLSQLLVGLVIARCELVHITMVHVHR